MTCLIIYMYIGTMKQGLQVEINFFTRRVTKYTFNHIRQVTKWGFPSSVCFPWNIIIQLQGPNWVKTNSFKKKIFTKDHYVSNFIYFLVCTCLGSPQYTQSPSCHEHCCFCVEGLNHATSTCIGSSFNVWLWIIGCAFH
jgi:hypothetical protein